MEMPHQLTSRVFVCLYLLIDAALAASKPQGYPQLTASQFFSCLTFSRFAHFFQLRSETETVMERSRVKPCLKPGFGNCKVALIGFDAGF